MSLIFRKAIVPKNVSLLKYFKGRPLATAANKKNNGVLSTAVPCHRNLKYKARPLRVGIVKPERAKPLTSFKIEGRGEREATRLRFCASSPDIVPLLRTRIGGSPISGPASSINYDSLLLQRTGSLPNVPCSYFHTADNVAKCAPACKPCPCPCGCPGCCSCLPPPCNTPPKCIQYMTGYYYYPYGFWFCGPYHVTGTCVPSGPCSPGGPCGPCCGPPCPPCGPCCGPCPCAPCPPPKPPCPCPKCCTCLSPISTAVVGGDPEPRCQSVQTPPTNPKSNQLEANYPLPRDEPPQRERGPPQSKGGISKFFPFNAVPALVPALRAPHASVHVCPYSTQPLTQSCPQTQYSGCTRLFPEHNPVYCTPCIKARTRPRQPPSYYFTDKAKKSNLASMKNKVEQLNLIRDIPVAGVHGLQRQAVPEKQKSIGSLLRCASCPCFGTSGPRQTSHIPCSSVLLKTHSAVFHQDHYRHPLSSKPTIKVSSNCRPYYRNEAHMAPNKQDMASNKVMQHLSNVCGSCCPCPGKCGPCGPCCGPCNCSLPAPCNTPPRCVQYMTGYYYYPYGFWFCGPYHVTGTCVPGGPVAPGGPCGPCAPNPGGPCGPCNPACVCGVLNSLAVMPTSDLSSTINIMPSEQAMNMLDVTKIKLPFDMSSVPMSCLPLYAPAKGGGSATTGGSATMPPMAGPCSVCGPCCGPCGPCCCGGPSAGGCGAPCTPCCGGCGPCGPCGPKGPFGPCGPCFPGVGCGCGGFGPCGSNAQCCVGPGCGCVGGCGGMCVGPCSPCGCFCGNCGPCGCGCCGPCGPCGPCGGCCGPCGPLTGPCGCGACGCGPCGCGACLPFGCGACCGVACPNSTVPCPSPSPPPPPNMSGLPPLPNASGQWTGPCINCKCSQPIPVNPASLGTAAGPGPFTQCCLALTDEEENSEDPEVSPAWTNVSEECPDEDLTPAAPKMAINTVQVLKRPGSNLTVFRRPGHNDAKQVDPNKPRVNSIFTCYQSTMTGNSAMSGTSAMTGKATMTGNSTFATSKYTAPTPNNESEVQKIPQSKFPTVENPRYCTPVVEREMPSFPNCFTYLNTHPRCAVKPCSPKATRKINKLRECPIPCK